MQFPRALAVALLVATAGLPLAAGRPDIPPDPREFLRVTGEFTGAELDTIERGGAVARVLDTERREVAVVGAIRIHAPVDRILAHYRDVSQMAESAAVLQVGTFSSPPRLDDLQPLVMEAYDLETIRECTPGDCGVRLSAAQMSRFDREVQWNAPDWQIRAGSSWRRMLVEYAGGYLTRGDSALAEYRNKAEPLQVAQELDILFGQSAFFKSAAPEFLRFAEEFPRGRPPHTDDLLYWTKDDFGIRPVISMTHLMLHKAAPDPPHGRPLAMIAAKQIYATHYFDAGLGLTAVYAHPSGGVLIVSQNRVRTRSLAPLMRAFVRSTVRSRSRAGMEKVLRSMKAKLEQDAMKTGGSAPVTREVRRWR
jgi:hypothetical protein